MNKKACIVIIISLYLGLFSTLAYAQDKAIVLRGCVEKDNQMVCPGSMDSNFSERQLLYYRNQDKKAMKRAIEHYNKGVYYENKGKLIFAKFHYQKAINFLPNFVEAHNNLGGIYICLKDYDKAIKEFEIVSELSPDYFSILYINLGLAYEGKGDLLKAEEYYQLALNLDNNSVLAHNNLASLYIKMKKMSEVQKHILIVNKLSPGFFDNNIIQEVSDYNKDFNLSNLKITNSVSGFNQ